MKLYQLIIIVTAVALGAVSFVIYNAGKEEPETPQKMDVGKPGKKNEIDKKRPNRKRVRPARKERVESTSTKKPKPTFDLPDDEEAKLNEEQRALIAEIRRALDSNDEKKLCALVQKMQASNEWPDGIPRSIRLTAIEALGWFGATCLPEIAKFLEDGDEEVLQSAIDKYQEALSDFDLSDRERSIILLEAAKFINDADALDSMLFELNNMRHSVAVSTLKNLMKIDNAALKSILPDNIDFYTGEEGMYSPQMLDQWLVDNPDDEFDEEFYGGAKNAN